MSNLLIEPKSAEQGGTHVVGAREAVTLVRSAIKFRVSQFMDPDYLEDCLDLLDAKFALEDPSSEERVAWEALKQEIGL